MRVLYVNHTAAISGGERSLLDLVRALPPEVEASLACPAGDLAAAATAQALPVRPLPGTDASLRLHPVHTPRALAEIGRAALALRSLVRASRPDLVHANSIRAGLICALAMRGRNGAVVHVRDRLPAGLASSASLGLVVRRARAVVANSRYTLDGVPARPGVPRFVVYSPVDLSRFGRPALSREGARRRLRLDGAGPVLAVVAQITPWKGQDTAIEVADLLRESYPELRLLLVGAPTFVSAATRFDNHAYAERLRSLVAERDLERHVLMLGGRDDVAEIISAADMVMVPSWEEPFGRSMVEAMAMGVPVAATSLGGPAEVITSGHDGLLLRPRDPRRWAAALGDLLARPEDLSGMGERARERAAAFSSVAHAERMLAVYRELLEQNGS